MILPTLPDNELSDKEPPDDELLIGSDTPGVTEQPVKNTITETVSIKITILVTFDRVMIPSCQTSPFSINGIFHFNP
jgi:hypothetical protein